MWLRFPLFPAVHDGKLFYTIAFVAPLVSRTSTLIRSVNLKSTTTTFGNIHLPGGLRTDEELPPRLFDLRAFCFV